MENQTRDREVIVTDSGRDNGIATALIAAVVVVVLAVIGIFVVKSRSSDDDGANSGAETGGS